MVSTTVDSVDEALGLLRAGVDELLAAALSPLAGIDLVGVLAELETQRRRLDAVDVRLLAEVVDRGAAHEFGATSAADLVTRRLRVSPHEASQRVARARDLGPRRELSGEPLPPLLPGTAVALAEGEISGAHVSVIAEAMDHLPAALGPGVVPVAEGFLLEAARHEHPPALRRSAALLLARLDPDGVEPREDEIERHRGVTLRSRGDGSTALSGRLTGETAAVWRTILDSLSASTPGLDGAADVRGPAQRRHDALLEAGLRLLRSGSLPASGGTPVTVLVRTSATDLQCPGGLIQTAHGELLSARRLLGLGGDAVLIPVTPGAEGAVLDLGRTRRLASPAQRRALAARDGGCCFPNCTRPAAWCEVHHVVAWEDGGGSDIANLCLLCPFHHRRLDTGDWTLRMIDGTPHWLPPPWLNPHRTPQRNTTHHLPDADVLRPWTHPDTG